MLGEIDDTNILNLREDFDWNKCNNPDNHANLVNFPLLTSVPSYEDFFTKYLCLNKPCILPINLLEDGNFDESWFDGGLNIKYLGSKYGKFEVPVYDCARSYFDSHQRTTRTLNEYLAYLTSPERSDLLYAKDWHLFSQHRAAFPAEPPLYRTPALFCSDWLNEFLEERSLVEDDRASLDDDYRFVYLGDSGTWTGLHSDVFSSFSWSANLLGSKLWLLFPPGQERLLLRGGALPVDMRALLRPGEPTDGALHQCVSSGAHYLLVRQEEGQVMFVPSGWHHQVWNDSPAPSRLTLSVNHNWFNAAGAMSVWRHLCAERRRVAAELSDVRPARAGGEGAWGEWQRQCELVLRALAGMNLGDFCSLLVSTARRRVQAVRRQRPLPALDGRRYSPGHVTADLRQLAALLEEVVDGGTECSETLTERVAPEVELIQHTLDTIDRRRDS